MKLRTFEELIATYDCKIDLQIYNERNKLLSDNSHSVILEGNQLEFENLEKFMIQKFGLNCFNLIVYDKIDYNYHFSEYFFRSSEQALATKIWVPKIYTTYPNSYPPNQISKTNGYNEIIEYNPKLNDDTIIF
jgi:hypothetical protein